MEWAISMNAGAICSSGVTSFNPRHKDARPGSKRHSCILLRNSSVLEFDPALLGGGFRNTAQLTSRHCPQCDREAGQEVLRRECADVVGSVERLRAGQQ
jgi:hypothetical protein